ncbi:molybdate ABC transporter substrate-binding protein [Scopulibacillus cellulosilyticus]|uniref:Molybdate ABC transporter substrate-binding protein n=1 Tax=Scopulibacillus cellulosilyticus TaxID=2665665 RepID=A0ABW2PRV2_9BACL
MKKISAICLFALLLLFAAAGCSANGQSQEKKADAKTNNQQQVTLTVSAAASLKDALDDIQKPFEKANPNIKLKFNFGGSGDLQKQIEQGAPADLFISASRGNYDQLAKEGLIKEGKNILGNTLVLVTPTNSQSTVKNFRDLKNNNVHKVAIGIPQTVPAGEYAKETLQHLNVWKTIQPKTVMAKDVRQVLSYAETGNVDAGIVYKTDALTTKKVKIVATASHSDHSPIVYPAGIIKDTKHPQAAKKLYHYLQTEQAQKIFKKYGFNVLNK